MFEKSQAFYTLNCNYYKQQRERAGLSSKICGTKALLSITKDGKTGSEKDLAPLTELLQYHTALPSRPPGFTLHEASKPLFGWSCSFRVDNPTDIGPIRTTNVHKPSYGPSLTYNTPFYSRYFALDSGSLQQAWHQPTNSPALSFSPRNYTVSVAIADPQSLTHGS